MTCLAGRALLSVFFVVAGVWGLIASVRGGYWISVGMLVLGVAVVLAVIWDRLPARLADYLGLTDGER